SDGQILLTWGAGAGSSFSLERLNSNGSLDTSFGNQGVVQTSFPNSTGQTQIVVQPDGKIVLASDGWTGKSGSYTPYSDLARYNANGSLDTSFDNQGTVVTSLSNSVTSLGYSQFLLLLDSLLLQANGQLIVAGEVGMPLGGHGLVMARYNANGSL